MIKRFIKVIKHIRYQNDRTLNLLNEQMAQERLMKLFDNGTYIPQTSWSMSPTFIIHIINLILFLKPKNVIEFSSGFTTLCLVKIIKKNKN